MKFIGYWMETLHETKLPVPQELVGDLPGPVRDRVCAYLEAGTTWASWRGTSWCRFGCGASPREMGWLDCSDGEWVWPQGLVHYVRHHGIVLPEKFIAGTLKERGPIGTQTGRPTMVFWKKWASRRRCPLLRERLARALAAASAAEQALVERLVEEARTNSVAGDERCTSANCLEQVLLGRRVCARHSITRDEIEGWSGNLYDLTEEMLGDPRAGTEADPLPPDFFMERTR